LIGKTCSLEVYRRSVPLHNLFDVQRCLARLINLSLKGKLPTADLSRYAHALNILQGVMQSGDLAKRLEILEKRFSGHL
jgi:hypothetical protein